MKEVSILVSFDEVGGKKYDNDDLKNQIEQLKGVKVEKIVEIGKEEDPKK